MLRVYTKTGTTPPRLANPFCMLSYAHIMTIIMLCLDLCITVTIIYFVDLTQRRADPSKMWKVYMKLGVSPYKHLRNPVHKRQPMLSPRRSPRKAVRRRLLGDFDAQYQALQVSKGMLQTNFMQLA